MSLPYLLFGLRVISALLLLAFLAGIAWMIYRELQSTTQLLEQQDRQQGFLRVVGSENGAATVGMVFPLHPETSIGRSQSCAITLDDSFVSNEHAVLLHRAQQWWLEDMGSSNGTLLNDIQVTEPVVISPGDIITIGGTRLMVEPFT